MPFFSFDSINQSILSVDDNGLVIPHESVAEYAVNSKTSDNHANNCSQDEDSSPSVAQNVIDSSADLSVKIGYYWECSASCGWGNNNKTQEASDALEELYGQIANFHTNDIYDLSHNLLSCSISSDLKGHDRTCSEFDGKDTFSTKSGCKSISAVLGLLAPHFKEIRTFRVTKQWHCNLF